MTVEKDNENLVNNGVLSYRDDPPFDSILTDSQSEGALTKLEELLRTESRLTRQATVAIERLRGILATASLPFRSTSQLHHRMRFQSIHTAESIRTLRTDYVVSENANTPEEEALLRARKEYDNLLESKEFRTGLAQGILDDLVSKLEDKQFKDSCHVLLEQTIVLIWSVFESFVKDSIRELLNQHPGLALKLLQDNKIKSLFGIKALALSDLERYNFDVGKSMGDILLSINGLSKLSDQQGLLEYFDSQHFLKSIHSNDMWMLFQKRHVIVHSAGFVDEHYATKTSDNTPIGEKLKMLPDSITVYIDLIIRCVDEVSRTIDHISKSRGETLEHSN